jgi:FkbM family methyltransferase
VPVRLPPTFRAIGGAGELSYKRALSRLLDRPGGRLILGKIATNFLQRMNGDGVEVVYRDGLWTHRVGHDFFPDGLRFEYADADFDSWKRQMDIYAANAKDYWLQHYRPQEGDVIVDVGAGRGEDTLAFSRAVAETGRVIAIEAHPVTFAILKNFCRLNRLTNVTPLQLALMDKAGTVRIAESESSWMENAIEYDEGSSEIQVRAGTLNEVCEQQGLKDIAFLKMNIEGAESHALLGMGPVIHHIRQICVACHDFRANRSNSDQFRTRAFVEQFLIDHGFTILAPRSGDPRDYVRDHVFAMRGDSSRADSS